MIADRQRRHPMAVTAARLRRHRDYWELFDPDEDEVLRQAIEILERVGK